MNRFVLPAAISLGLVLGAGTVRAEDSWFAALKQHVRSNLLHKEVAPFDFQAKELKPGAGLTIVGEKVHLENGLLTASFQAIKGDDGMLVQNVNVNSKLSLGGDFLNDPVRKCVEAFLDYMDMTAAKMDLAFGIFALAKDETSAPTPGNPAPIEMLKMPARDLKMTMRGKLMEMHVKSVVNIKAQGKASYRPAEKKIDVELTGAWSGPIPIPMDLVFMTLKNTIKFPFVEIHKPYLTIDVGWFLE